MAAKIQHNFHQTLEPVQTQNLPKIPTVGIEAMEIAVLFTVVYFIFFMFRDFKKDRYAVYKLDKKAMSETNTAVEVDKVS